MKTTAEAKKAERIEHHQWTHDGNQVLLVKCVERGGKSRGGFQWPREGEVTTPNWAPEPTCESGGLFGWPWGLGLGGGKEPNYFGDWIVFAANPESVVWIEDGLNSKAKAGPTAQVVYYGSWAGATSFTQRGREAWILQASSDATEGGTSGAASSTGTRGAASSTGDRGAASSTGTRGAASSTGDSGAASSTGDSGAASSTGTRGAASSTGTRGAASSTGTRGAASSTGYSGAAALTGLYGSIEVGPNAAGVVTCDEFTWIVHLGAVVLHRWSSGHTLLTTEGLTEGERVAVVCGEITREAKV